MPTMTTLDGGCCRPRSEKRTSTLLRSSPLRSSAPWAASAAALASITTASRPMIRFRAVPPAMRPNSVAGTGARCGVGVASRCGHSTRWVSCPRAGSPYPRTEGTTCVRSKQSSRSRRSPRKRRCGATRRWHSRRHTRQQARNNHPSHAAKHPQMPNQRRRRSGLPTFPPSDRVARLNANDQGGLSGSRRLMLSCCSTNKD